MSDYLTVNTYNDIAIIVGNGFDLSLGLKTSFYHFINSPQFQAIIPHNPLAQWLHELQLSDSTRWLDLEMELTSLCLGKQSKYNFEDCDPRNAQELNYYALFIELKQALIGYLNSIDYKMTDEIRESKAYHLLKDVAKANCLIVNFNYTPSVLNILEDLDYHSFAGMGHHFIHGALSNGDIVVGAGSEEQATPKFKFIKKAHQEAFNPYRLTEVLMETNKIYFYGHTLGQPDYSYFRKFFKKLVEIDDQTPKKICLYTKDSRSLTDIMGHLEVLTDNRLQELKERHQLIPAFS